MKADLDRLMEAAGVDALLITGPAQHNPPMYYLTGDAHLTNADLVKKRGSDPVLFHYPMERDEAARTGLACKNLGDYRLAELFKQCNGDFLQASILRYRKMLEDVGLTSGRVAVYGKVDAGAALALFSGLQGAMAGLSILGEVGDSIVLNAMTTKDPDEVERIRRMGRLTAEVVGRTADFLTSHPVKDGTLVTPEGRPLTIGDVKSRIAMWTAELGGELPEGVIFAIGRDGGVPHSTGNPADPLRLGQPIVFDIFPCEAGGGYHYDFTRTWCLGYVPDEVQAVYEDVREVYRQILSELKPNTRCQEYQTRTCELFEARGHPTVKSDPQTQEGYVHGLGHGVGLHVHELPRFGLNSTENDRLDPGVVVTIEPGLYYPERGIGVRLEDTLWVRPDGSMEILVEYPQDLLLPMK